VGKRGRRGFTHPTGRLLRYTTVKNGFPIQSGMTIEEKGATTLIFFIAALERRLLKDDNLPFLSLSYSFVPIPRHY
jgi:hypothetical protein